MRGVLDRKYQMAEHAEALGSDDLAGLASFLSDTPEGTADEKNEATESPPEESDTDETDNAQQEESTDETEEVAPEDEEAEETPTPERKIAVTIKGDDGEETIEVSEEELVKGYHRQASYTKSMQALAERENQAVQFLKGKHEEVRQHYLSQAELARQAVLSMAGLKTESEMAQLANSDPAAWVAENQRQNSVNNYLKQLDQQISGEREKATKEAEAEREQVKAVMFQKAWKELEKEKIDKPALMKIYEGASKSYGFSSEELGNVYDHRIVKMMRDAQAFRELKAKAPEVTRKVQAAPKLPSKQASSAQDRRDKELDARFKGGRGKLKDLAQYLS